MSTPDPNKKSYKQTLNLPQTAFPMEAKLVQNEPARLARWREMDLYQKLMDARAGSPQWLLHDGPPFANGDIHIGHLINKTLKDVIIRFRSMQGFRSPYIPGWDCHGLPIEHKIQEQLGPRFREMPVAQVRQMCFDYAAKYAAIQSEQFQRLGILGDWAHPYLTMAPEYEASTLDVFALFVDAGLVYKKLKPVPWSVQNQTALADAELEYKDVDDPSIFIEFPAASSASLKKTFAIDAPEDVFYLVWTTTPWTLPANLAIAVHPEFRYAFVRYRRNGRSRIGVVAEELVKTVFNGRKDVELGESLVNVTGRELVDPTTDYRHPFIDRTGRILPALYVTTTDGTGLVHTAPGHGEDDYATGISNGLPVYCPVLHNGRFDDTAPEWIRGMTVWEANPVITAKLRETGLLFDQVTIRHSYPHDWRSKKPVILRATEQWFVSVDQQFHLQGEAGGRSLRQRALHAIEKDVQFIPEWGAARIGGMLQSRPDWCISRQRSWGLPIPVFYNERGEPLLSGDSVRAIAKRFAEKGSNAWFTQTPAELLGDFDPGPRFPKDQLRKEQDIFDVWFESGSSWHAVLRARPGLNCPCEMYLEGSDQHRGWFQLSLLPSLGVTGQPPYKQVLTHGFVVKPDGTKVSKSDKEYVTATQEIDRHGADLLRLWCCSVDYQNDIPTSPQVIKEFGDKYRKIRNTLRYLLSNLYDFNPETDSQAVPQNSLDGWAMAELDNTVAQVTAAYENYQLHRAFRLLHDLCAVQISALYAAAMKDRLYCEAPAAPLRRRCQTVMYHMAIALTKLLAPMLVFTADETWEHIQHKPAEDAGLPSVHLALLPKPSGQPVLEQQREEWKLLMELRDQAMLQVDVLLRKFPKQIKPLDLEVVFHIADPGLRRRLEAYGPDLEDLIGAGCRSFADAPAGSASTVEVIDRRDAYQACARSWKRRPDVGGDPQYPDLSHRDAQALRAMQS